jgi:enoyl-CoA hydratase
MNPGTATGNGHIRWNILDGIGHMVLNQPPSNEMTIGFFEEMNTLTARLSEMQGIRGIIITGIGRHFSSGADLDELLGTISATGCGFLQANRRSMNFIEDASVPVVAAVRGVCLGSAFELALRSHFRICCEDAVFGLPESTFNLMPGLGGIRRIAALSGKANALELALRGRTFSAEEALALGLVDSMVPKKQLQHAAIALINSVSAGYRKEKRALYKTRYLTHHVPIDHKAV